MYPNGFNKAPNVVIPIKRLPSPLNLSPNVLSFAVNDEKPSKNLSFTNHFEKSYNFLKTKAVLSKNVLTCFWFSGLETNASSSLVTAKANILPKNASRAVNTPLNGLKIFSNTFFIPESFERVPNAFFPDASYFPFWPLRILRFSNSSSALRSASLFSLLRRACSYNLSFFTVKTEILCKSLTVLAMPVKEKPMLLSAVRFFVAAEVNGDLSLPLATGLTNL